MFDTTKRKLRMIGSALLIATIPVSGLAVAPAMAQAPAMPGMPDMSEPYPLTSDLVLAWVESYPEIVALTESLSEQYEIPEGEDAMGAIAAMGAVEAVMDQLNGAVGDYGFESWEQWTEVMFAVVYSYSILQAPAEQRAMMLGIFNQPEENLAVVEANMQAVADLVENL